MTGKRLVYVSRSRNGSEYILKIRKNIHGWRTWFIYDPRTKSVRLYRNRRYAISNQRHIGLRQGGYAVVRRFVRGADQKLYFKSTNITNKIGNCLTLRSFLNQDEQALTFFECRGIGSQSFKRVYHLSTKLMDDYMKRRKIIKE